MQQARLHATTLNPQLDMHVNLQIGSLQQRQAETATAVEQLSQETAAAKLTLIQALQAESRHLHLLLLLHGILRSMQWFPALSADQAALTAGSHTSTNDHQHHDVQKRQQWTPSEKLLCC